MEAVLVNVHTFPDIIPKLYLAFFYFVGYSQPLHCRHPDITDTRGLRPQQNYKEANGNRLRYYGLPHVSNGL